MSFCDRLISLSIISSRFIHVGAYRRIIFCFIKGYLLFRCMYRHIVFIHSSINGHLDFPCGSAVKNPPTVQETQVWCPSWEDPLKEGLATHSCVLAWRIPWTEEPGGLQSIRSQRDRHSWSGLACMHWWAFSCFHIFISLNSPAMNMGVFIWGSFEHLFEILISVILDKYPEIGLLNHIVVLFLIFWGISIQFSTVVAPIYIPTNRAQWFFFFNIFTNSCFLLVFW